MSEETKPKFLTGTPRWMERGPGRVLLYVLGIGAFVGTVRLIASWF